MKLLWVFILFGACSAVALADEPPAPKPSTVLVVDGETYEDVKYINASAAKITFRHKRGIASLPIEKFPPDVQRKFGYNPQKADEERTAEEARLREHNERVEAAAATKADADKKLAEDVQRRIEAERSDIRRADDEVRRRQDDERRMLELRNRDADRRRRWGVVFVNPNPNPQLDPNLKRHQDAKFNYMQSAIHSGNIQRVQQLITKDPTYITCRGDEGEYPLHVAASLGFDTICGILLDAKADPSPRCNKGKTPVRWARDAQKLSTADFLRKRGCTEF